MGVVSLKLEGRMKRPEYVAAVTGVYRSAIDGNVVTRAMMDTLSEAFNRQGFTDGYYANRLGEDMFGVREDAQTNSAFAKQMRQTYELTENPLVPIAFQATLTPSRSVLTVADADGRKCTVEGPVPEPAKVQELTEDALVARLQKTGGTPYYCKGVIANITPGITLSAAAINAMRRDALNMLTALRGRRDLPAVGKAKKPTHFAGNRHHPVLTVQVTTKEQITGRLLKMNPAVLYVPLHLLEEDDGYTRWLTDQVNVCAVLPRIVHDGELAKLKQSLSNVRMMGVREALIGNLGLLLPVRECRMQVRGDFGLNLYNSAAVNTTREMELSSATLSFEMTLPQIRDVSKAVPCELLVYGRMQLMVTENCLIRGRTGECSCHLGPTKLVDKTGAEFPVIRDGNTCRSVLLNGKKLNWLDRQNDLGKLGLWATRLYFTTENPKEVDQILSHYRNPVPFDPGACTRGLYLRGLD